MIKSLFIYLGIPLLVVIAVSFYLFSSATRLPDNTPQTFLKKKVDAEKKVVVCIGDSLTHGRVSSNYVDELSERPSNNAFLFVNAGINSELAYNVLQRIDEIIALKPDYVTVLIGSNDVLASLDEKSARRFIKKWNLPQKPTKEWFRKNLMEIVVRLQKETRAGIAVLSLPPVTEDVHHIGYKRAREYSDTIRAIADEKQLAYLPLNEKLDRAIQEKVPKSGPVFIGPERTLMYKAIARHYLLGQSWDRISEKNGFLFLTDFIHLNAKGAILAADLIEGFIRQRDRVAPDHTKKQS